MINNRHLCNGCILSDRYLISETLGEGGFSITYKAVHIDMQKVVAIKEFFHHDYMYRDIRISKDIQLVHESDMSIRDRDLKNFLEEARILASLSNVVGIVHVTDFFRQNKTAYIVMEFVEGISLEEQLKNGYKYAWDDLVRKILPVIGALGKIHDAGIIHRDIKPGNIIISGDGSFTLIDFGAALHFVGEETHSIYLSEGYAPIEQYLRKSKLGTYTDIYALCAVLYRCITGIIPENSIQRAVFDELKTPSEMGVSIPVELESAIIKGMQIEPELRWQTMADFYQELSSLLPIEKKLPKIVYILSGIVAALIIVSSIYVGRHYKELKISHMCSDGKAITFRLDAPEDMTTNEFEQATKVIEERINTFAGDQSYYIQKDTTSILVTMPDELLTGTGNWDKNAILYTLFSFSGKWWLHNADMTEYMELTPEDINHVELEYGHIPVVTNSGESILYDGETIDWASKEGYYLKIEFQNRAASFLNDYLKKEGFVFMAETSRNNSDTNSYWWISNGDGKTAYFFIGPSEDKNIAETLYQILMEDIFSRSLELFWQEENVKWDNPNNKKEKSYHCSIEDMTYPTVEVLCTLYDNNETDVRILKDFCGQQLSFLEIPYAIGQDDTAIHVRVPYEQVTNLVLFSMCGNDIYVDTGWGDGYGIEAAVLTDDAQQKIKAFMEEESFHATMEFFDKYQSDTLYLYIDSVRIGIMDSVDRTEKTITFKLLLPDDGDTIIPYNKVANYLCSIASNQSIPHVSYSQKIWRDEHNRILSNKEIPDIPAGVDLSRFSPIKSSVEELGGTVSFSEDFGAGEMQISFEQWTGIFPEDALKMIETIFHSNNMADNICGSIQFNIHSWYKGDDVEICVLFCPEEESHSVVCMSGRIDSTDKAVLEKAKKYIVNSDLFTPSEDRFLNEDDIIYNDSEDIWEYNLLN